MKQKIKVGIIFGGKSAEHDVSLKSAENIFKAIDKNTYIPILIFIDKNGKWFLLPDLHTQSDMEIILVPQGNGKLLSSKGLPIKEYIDVAFPVLHGPFGEDGTIQGLLQIAHIPFVGSDVLGSAIGMDKDVMKRLLRDANIPIGKFLTFQKNNPPIYEDIYTYLGSPFFVKPANMGSSIGINKVTTKEHFDTAIQEAFQYDNKIIIEENIIGREIECSVLGNESLRVSIPGEIISHQVFYSYTAKYIDNKASTLQIPAELSSQTLDQIQNLAIKTFQTLCCEGLGRIDFFLKENGDILVNEINTMPGFTSKSMYPKLWEFSGITYSELIDELINLTFERFDREQQLKISI